GWSFGTELALKHGADLDVEGAVLLSPPLSRAKREDLERWARTEKPVTALVPEFDDFLTPDQAVPGFAPLTQARVIPVEGAKHLWVGEKYVRIVLDLVMGAVLPGAESLPTSVPATAVVPAGEKS
ncbi:MAG: alpha/beta hydrolase, partial [Actinobacteria bacterium HGW-Actinobacteria-8]